MHPELNPAAPHHLPFYIAGPSGPDAVLVGTGLFLLLVVFGFGLLFLHIHTLPERIAHRGHKLQFEIVAVLGLLALFTHIQIFWVVGLFLALIDLPDLTGPLRRMAGAQERMAGLAPGAGDTTEGALPPPDAPEPADPELDAALAAPAGERS